MSFCEELNFLTLERSGNVCRGDKYTNITKKMKIILVDWLITISDMFKLRKDTLFLSLQLLNSCLDKIEPTKDQLQGYGCMCLMIAAKKHEIYAPEMSDFADITNGEYDCYTLKKYESNILKNINYNVELPTIPEYIRRISNILGTSAELSTHRLAIQLTLLYLIDNNEYLPSILATSAYKIAVFIRSTEFINEFKIPEDVLNKCCRDIIELIFRYRNTNLKDIRTYEKVLKDFKVDIDKDFYEKLNSKECKKMFVIPFNDKKDKKEGIGKKVWKLKTNIIPSNNKEYTINNYYVNNITKIIAKKDIITTKKLGEGTFGVVKSAYFYENDDLKNPINCAWKKTKSEFWEEGVDQSFIREISILQNINHKNVVKFIGIVDNYKGFLLELMSCDLKKYLDYNGKSIGNYKFQEYCTKELLDGLKYLHSNGIIIRDIKPQNILVRGKWDEDITKNTLEIKYCDFGMSRGKGLALNEGSFTHEICTLWYRSPEILLGKQMYGPGLDIWSLACTLYELCTGKPFANGDCEIQQITKIFHVLGTPTEQEWPGVTELPDYRASFPRFRKNEDTFTDVKLSPKVIKVMRSGFTLSPEKRPNIDGLYNQFIEIENVI